MVEAHKHHEGPITIELINNLLAEIRGRLMILADANANEHGIDWFLCQEKWASTFGSATHYLNHVRGDIEKGLPLTDEIHLKIVDNCLSIMDDFDRAKMTNFENPQFQKG